MGAPGFPDLCGCAAGLAAAAGLGADLGAGLCTGFFAGGTFVFDFAADFDAITILCAAHRRRIAKRAARARVAPPERIKAGSLGIGSLSPD
jgi:hypothetical protein